MRSLFKRYLVTGILVLVPGVVSLMVLVGLVRWVARNVKFGILPDSVSPGFAHLPELVIQLLNRALQFADFGLSLLIVLAVILAVGAVAHNYLGRRLIKWGEAWITRVPLLGMVYKALQQLVEAVFSRESKFNRVVLLQYPRPGIWSLGFVSRDSSEFFNRETGRKMWNVFLPTTPNPTSGYLILVPKSECQELDMSIEEAFNLIISGGIIDPGDARERKKDGLSAGN